MGIRNEPHPASLSPFLLTCTTYFLLWIPEDPPSWLGALVKCLPVLSLAGLLRAHPGPSGSYSLRLQAALLFSALGDAFLIWPDLFLHGVLACATAHLFYIWAFGLSPLRPSLLLPVVLASLPFSGLLLLHLSSSLVLPLAAYALALSTMLWRGLCPGLLLPVFLGSLPFSFLLLQHLPPDLVLPLSAYALALAAMLWRGLARGGSARWGALLFAASDCLLSWHTFVRPLAHGRLLIMATYYAAQLLIALPAFQNPKLKTD
ncbi:lysoplasmalogenase-like isoform X2 [Pipistrellus kuhlii]|uniref:lysoplasmalogenase-like isoform X2 n=1 Tax=Pipistrellus kuhlii TaxID=59472 RepID=UPI00174F22D7|nr:lysoplasmalogenase-like isoform X2 [Pipistrellus kuhlii]